MMNAFMKLSTLHVNTLLKQMACNHDFSIIRVFFSIPRTVVSSSASVII